MGKETDWYIVITNPNCHRRAEYGLAAAGYPAFWPKMRKWTSHARTKIPKEYPILGRYLFVDIPDQEFFTVRNVNGVEALLTGDNGAPATIPAKIVWAFRDRYMRGEWDFVASETGEFEGDEFEEFVDENGEVRLRRKKITRRNSIPNGGRVKIMEGEFANLLTTVRRGSKNGKLAFLPPGRREFVYTSEGNVRAA